MKHVVHRLEALLTYLLICVLTAKKLTGFSIYPAVNETTGVKFVSQIAGKSNMLMVIN